MDLGLAGRACVVTGASNGIGRETARMLCAEGASVLLVARTERACEAADECGAAGSERAAGRDPRRRRDRPRRRGPDPRRRPSSASAPSTCSSTTPGVASWRDLDDVPEEDWYAAWELNVMAPMRLMRATIPAMRSAAGAASSTSPRPRASVPRPRWPSTRSRRRPSSRSPASTPTATPATASWSTRSAPARPNPRCGWTRAACSTSQATCRTAISRRRGPRGRRRQAPDRPPRRGRGDRGRDRLPLLRARLLRLRRRLEGRRRHRPGDHLSGLGWGALLTPEEAGRMEAHGDTEAAVLVPLFGWPERPRPGLHRAPPRPAPPRRRDLVPRRPPRRPDADLVATALREAEEEIGLDPAAVELAGALPPTGTFVTGYKVHPFVGLIATRTSSPSSRTPTEVETRPRLHPRGARGRLRRCAAWSAAGSRIHTPTYEVDGRLIWGATARILGELLERLAAA